MSGERQDELVFLPLGGSNEIGMNFNLYGYGPPHARQWIVVDLGVTFGDQTTPGVEIILPDPTYIEEYAENILGIVLTHAHEDHFGAIIDLWPKLKCQIYATKFSAALFEAKCASERNPPKIPVTVVPSGGRIDLGPFNVEFIPVAHSIPESHALAIHLASWSSATIRNDLANLVDVGYLLQPHTSAGRVPSDRGYRYYVDFLMEEEAVPVVESAGNCSSHGSSSRAAWSRASGAASAPFPGEAGFIQSKAGSSESSAGSRCGSRRRRTRAPGRRCGTRRR